NLWVTIVSTRWGDSIAKVTTAGWGSFTNYRLPGASPQSITVGADNNLWFTEAGTNSIGRITTTGVVTQFALGAGRGPQSITAGPDGALWFTETTGNAIGRITTAGAVTEYAVPTAGSSPFALAVGPAGDLWFTEQTGNRIGKVTLP